MTPHLEAEDEPALPPPSTAGLVRGTTSILRSAICTVQVEEESLDFVLLSTSLEWTEWAPWSSCSVSCGGGSRSRDRNCTLDSDSNGLFARMGSERMSSIGGWPTGILMGSFGLTMFLNSFPNSVSNDLAQLPIFANNDLVHFPIFASNDLSSFSYFSQQ